MMLPSRVLLVGYEINSTPVIDRDRTQYNKTYTVSMEVFMLHEYLVWFPIRVLRDK